MPTIEGPWTGSGTKARIIVDYTRSYNADRTVATFVGAFSIEFNGAVNDNTNTYDISGDCGSQSGSKNYDFGNAGGKKQLGTTWTFTKSRDGSVKCVADNIAGTGGGRIVGDFVLPVGNLAPNINVTSFSVRNVTATSFEAVCNPDNVSWHGVGNLIQLQYNTAPTDAGATATPTTAWFGVLAAQGLTPGTTYYWRMRASNVEYGWSGWSNWVPVSTSPSAPGAPALSVGAVGQTFTDVGATAAANGSPITAYEIAVNTAQTLVGATSFSSGALRNLMPNTLYYFVARAQNSLGWGPWGEWGSFRTRPSVLVNVNGVWKNAIPYVNVNGVWKTAERFVNVNNVWKR